MEKKIAYDLKDVEKELKVNVRTLREYVKRGKLKAKKIGRSYYVSDSGFRQFVGDN